MRFKIPFLCAALAAFCLGAVATPALAQYNGAPVTVTSQDYYPAGATPITAASGVVTAATATATLTATSTTKAWITGFSITGGGATGASLITCTVTGLVTGTQSYVVGVVAGVTLANPKFERAFSVPVPASAVNTNIVVSCPTFGVGNNGASVNAEGYLK